MNILKNNGLCCGCGICKIICPRDAIEMKLDSQGFYNPVLENKKCTNCSMCIQICPKFNVGEKKALNTKSMYAGESLNKKSKKNSSSGGIGHELAIKALESDFSVIGVAYNAKLNIAQHCVAETEKDLKKFQGSKYLQSFTDALSVLRYSKNRKYMIFGTPCQIKAIRKFIEIKGIEENYILVDVFCRGVPSYLLWKQYLRYLQREYCLENPVKVIFRNKEKGWHSCSILCEDGKKTYSKEAKEDWFYKLYTSALCFRESCYYCNLKLEECYADIRLGDFWGKRFAENEEGISIVVANTEKGRDFMNKLDRCCFYETDLSEVKEAQKYIYNKRTKKVDQMRKALMSETHFEVIYKKLIEPNMIKKWILWLYQKSPEKFKQLVRKKK